MSAAESAARASLVRRRRCFCDELSDVLVPRPQASHDHPSSPWPWRRPRKPLREPLPGKPKSPTSARVAAALWTSPCAAPSAWRSATARASASGRTGSFIRDVAVARAKQLLRPPVPRGRPAGGRALPPPLRPVRLGMRRRTTPRSCKIKRRPSGSGRTRKGSDSSSRGSIAWRRKEGEQKRLGRRRRGSSEQGPPPSGSSAWRRRGERRRSSGRSASSSARGRRRRPDRSKRRP
mmetsp:Transcript_57267/g.153315  ORF Transcript_57267/g.153315 Transcript_57267/m.153315 type:complete len:235 (-) Transcript_57267:439-1143(-)